MAAGDGSLPVSPGPRSVPGNRSLWTVSVAPWPSGLQPGLPNGRYWQETGGRKENGVGGSSPGSLPSIALHTGHVLAKATAAAGPTALSHNCTAHWIPVRTPSACSCRPGGASSSHGGQSPRATLLISPNPAPHLLIVLVLNSPHSPLLTVASASCWDPD